MVAPANGKTRKGSMMTKIVNSWNDWDPLKRVIVGRADNSVIPPEEPATSEKVPVDSAMRGMWGPRPLETVEKANAQLDNLVDVLEEARSPGRSSDSAPVESGHWHPRFP